MAGTIAELPRVSAKPALEPAEASARVRRRGPAFLADAGRWVYPWLVEKPSLASEFPNDNAAISGGAIWVCEELVGPARVEIASPVESTGSASVAVESARFVLDFDTDDETGPEPPGAELPARADAATVAPALAHFESALVEALLAQGATRAAAIVPLLLRLEPLPVEALAKDALLTLQSRGYLDGSGRYSPKYRDLCRAWCAVLQGSSQDFAACGTTTLDRFGADLLAALLAVPATRADELRRGLRRAGIAAFGVLDAA